MENFFLRVFIKGMALTRFASLCLLSDCLMPPPAPQTITTDNGRVYIVFEISVHGAPCMCCYSSWRAHLCMQVCCVPVV